MEEQGRLTDSRIASQEHQGPWHQTAPQHPIQLAEPGVQTGQGWGALVLDGSGALRARWVTPALGGWAEAIGTAVPTGRLGLLNKGIPAATGRTAAEKLATLGPAALADVDGNRTGQGLFVCEERWLSVNRVALRPFQWIGSVVSAAPLQ